MRLDLAPAVPLLALAAYLFRPVEQDGDGAAYTLQACCGAMLDRPTHLGWLLPLSVTTRTGLQLGLTPAAWTNLASLAAAAAILGILRAEARDDGAGPWSSWLPGLVWLGSATVWDAALFAEVYAPLSLAVLLCWRGAIRERPWAGWALAWAVSIHPGALALVPAMGVLAPKRRRIGLVLLPVLTAAILVCVPGWLRGGRGLLDLPSFDRSVFQSLQAAWRLVARDLGPTTVLPLAGLVIAARAPDLRRRAAAAALLLLGVAVAIDRFRDNPGALVSLTVFCTFVPWSGHWARAISDPGLRTAAAVGAVVLTVLGIAEGTSRHDATARRATRDEAVLRRDCLPRPESWQGGRLRALACPPP